MNQSTPQFNTIFTEEANTPEITTKVQFLLTTINPAIKTNIKIIIKISTKINIPTTPKDHQTPIFPLAISQYMTPILTIHQIIAKTKDWPTIHKLRIIINTLPLLYKLQEDL